LSKSLLFASSSLIFHSAIHFEFSLPENKK
jgi:hypothetical protein